MKGILAIMANEIIPSNLDLFSAPPTQIGISEVKYEIVNCKNRLGESQGLVLFFEASPDLVNYTNLNESYLTIKAAYFTNEDLAVGNEPSIAPINNILSSMWSSVDMYINDEQCTPVETLQPYCQWLQNFSQSREVKDSELTTAVGTMIPTRRLREASE